MNTFSAHCLFTVWTLKHEKWDFVSMVLNIAHAEILVSFEFVTK